MKTAKKYGKTLGFFLGCVLLCSCFFSLLNLGGLMQTKVTDAFLILVMILLFAFLGFRYGKLANKKGYLEGLKIGLCLLFFLFIINLLFYQTKFSLERMIYYVVLILSSVLGSMVGINKKK